MRAFALFVAYIAALLVGGALLEYPVYRLARLFDADIGYWTLSGRLTIPLGLITLYPFLRWMRLADAASLGYALRRGEFPKALLVGWVLGVAMMLPLFGLLLGLGARVLDLAPPAIPAALLTAAAGAFFSGLSVAFIEETFFRGALYTAVARLRGPVAAIVLSSVLYALLHFVDSDHRVPAHAIGWETGLRVLLHSFGAFATPQEILDSALALTAAGVFLGLVRLRDGHIARCIGLHAGWVFAIKELKAVSHGVPEAPWGWLIGGYDKVTGWLALVWLLLIMAMILRSRRSI